MVQITYAGTMGGGGGPQCQGASSRLFSTSGGTGDVPGGGGGLGSPKETWSLPRSLGGGGGDAAAGGGVFAFGVCSEEAYEEAYDETPSRGRAAVLAVAEMPHGLDSQRSASG